MKYIYMIQNIWIIGIAVFFSLYHIEIDSDITDKEAKCASEKIQRPICEHFILICDNDTCICVK